ncbi:DUF2569 domain-containing protein [Cytophaga hutchinsonii]|jgi:hypothetical protein|uniref:DUF2569 domain-containing protein n=1 Tax=Cytophaga hutchinsonii (strain ATCC 33406 / DSM 1761 / CIP 103989 / NBRC 15051 / NCIMB 9469 / D465) TaxID=269798 RepID=A0A6N4SW32_CYTH3|nr:DUF2569 domain-containing protein [Cytophaga hutchinsonii]ABG60750.1 conserved hypothetical protein [Cytophaga hutchinsonii ATCC 33406]SFX71112.1 Protein of unknown function [Cytophaga hutchinsonii ATCC 33406]
MENDTLDLDQLPEKEQKYNKIGGWMIIPVIGLFITPLRLTVSLFKDLIPAVTGPDIALYEDPASELYTPALRYLLYGEIFVNVGFSIFAIVILVHLFKFKSITPLLYITFVVSNLVFVVADSLIVLQLGLGTTGDFFDKELFQAIVSCSIWIPFFLLSERVKGTFVK